MTWRLFLDDERDPPRKGGEWTVARSCAEAEAFCIEHGAPSFVSFDNDLGDPAGREGWHFAQWLIDRDLDAAGTWLPADFAWFVHSQNPVRRDDIHGRLARYADWRSAAPRHGQPRRELV